MSRIFLAGVLSFGLMSVDMVLAQDTNKFKTTLGAGVTLTAGNSKTMQANASLVTEGEKNGLVSCCCLLCY